MGCDSVIDVILTWSVISIHASRMGCDQTIDDYGAFVEISIHASRMGCDRSVDGTGIAVPDFNPRIPYGMRLKIADKSFTVTEFQSTHPVWDATHFTRLVFLAR